MKNARFLLLGAAALLCACHKHSDSAPASVPAPHIAPKAPVVQKGPSVAQQTAGMVEAAAQGKSPLPVALKFELTQRPKVGQVLQINLALIPQVDGGPASIKVNGGDGINVVPDPAQADIPEVEAGGVYRQTVSVTPTDEGVLLLGVTVSLKHDEITDLKAFYIPLIADR